MWNPPLAGVEVKFPGVVPKAAPQMGEHVSRIRDLPLDGALRGLDEGDRPVTIQAKSLLLSPNFSSFGLAPAGPWLEPGQTSRLYSRRVGNKVQTFTVYEAEVSAALVTTVTVAVRDAALGARRSALLGIATQSSLSPGRSLSECRPTSWPAASRTWLVGCPLVAPRTRRGWRPRPPERGQRNCPGKHGPDAHLSLPRRRERLFPTSRLARRNGRPQAS